MNNSNLIIMSFFIIVFGKLFLHYFPLYIGYFFETNPKWNKSLEKPRIGILIILLLVMILISGIIYLSNNFYNLIFLGITLIFLIYFFFKCFDDKFIINRKNNIQKKLNTKINHKINNPKNAYSLLIENKIIVSSFESFNSFIDNKDLTTKKLIWIDITMKKTKNQNGKREGNLQTLYQFISTVFETKDKSFIENKIEIYFNKSKTESFVIQNNSHYDWFYSRANYLPKFASNIKTMIS